MTGRGTGLVAPGVITIGWNRNRCRCLRMLDRMNKDSPLAQHQRQQSHADEAAQGTTVAQAIHGQLRASGIQSMHRIPGGKPAAAALASTLGRQPCPGPVASRDAAGRQCPLRHWQAHLRSVRSRGGAPCRLGRERPPRRGLAKRCWLLRQPPLASVCGAGKRSTAVSRLNSMRAVPALASSRPAASPAQCPADSARSLRRERRRRG